MSESSVLRFVPPMLPTLVDTPPGGREWLHEIKYDGYRTQLVIDSGEVRAHTRNGHDWSDRYWPIVAAARQLRCSSAIIDAEMCVQDQWGVTDYDRLLTAIGSAPEQLILFAFDLLYLDGIDLRFKPLLDRRRLLQLIGPLDEATSRIQFSPHHVGDGLRLFNAADKAGLEGIVSKRCDSRYAAGMQAQSWLKTKCFTVSDLQVLGVDRSSSGVPLALLGSAEGAYVGDAMIALDADDREEFWATVERMGTPRARLAWMAKRKTARWVKSGLRARVKHLRGGDKLLRHATLQGLGLRVDP